MPIDVYICKCDRCYVNRVTESALKAIPEADFIRALIALTPHDLSVIAKPALEPESAPDHDRNVIAETYEYADSYDRSVIAQCDGYKPNHPNLP